MLAHTHPAGWRVDRFSAAGGSRSDTCGNSTCCFPLSLEAGRLLSRSGPLREVREHLRTGRTISWTGWRAVTSRVLGPTGAPTDLLVKAATARDPNAEPTLANFGAYSVL